MTDVAGSYLRADGLRDLRLGRGWSARQLADECERFGPPLLTRSTIAKIEAGVRKAVTSREVAVFAAALGVDTSRLLCGASVGPVVRGLSVPVVSGPDDWQGVKPTYLREARTLAFDAGSLPELFGQVASYCTGFERPVEIVALSVVQAAPPDGTCALMLTWMPWPGL